jgi:GNAT superfamily N-acetyltransferase
MGFAIEISEVGPAEFPLIDVVRRILADEYHDPPPAQVEELLNGRTDALVLIAHLESNPVGYLIGHRTDNQTFHALGTGILKDYRGQGIEQRLREWTEQFAASRKLTLPIIPSRSG